ncbi:uncharacterized protein KY384_001376 [Bacidia gigantensis]|uniref:uncharacterized protein n=1 Tax=Bacidia gigantensis TaxID=2732470 RepID=UPI001D0426A6|nr:uncharacterized protein KY384_001376 [Bacidia gigantensis]KAG8533635.1 hypothetical protein KY384_001376 [Bacidia gigantensis]
MFPVLLTLLTFTTLSTAWIPSTVSAANTNQIKGFNYAPEDDFATKFKTAQNLEGTSGFTSARLFAMKSAKGNKFTEAFDAANATGTTLLLTLWSSGDPVSDPLGDTAFAAEKAALEAALDQWVGKPPNNKPEDFKNMVIGISVGSEDLYRSSVWGTPRQDDYGNTVEKIIDFVEQTRVLLDSYALRGVIPVGHADTWVVWKNESTGYKLASDLDWVGLNDFTYWENLTVTDFAAFTGAVGEAQGASRQGGNPPVWVTESGWPVTGLDRGKATVGTANAKTYWDGVGCQQLFGHFNTWWYTLHDPPYDPKATPPQVRPQFAVTNADGDTKPLFDLSCDGAGTTQRSVKERGLEGSDNYRSSRRGRLSK